MSAVELSAFELEVIFHALEDACIKEEDQVDDYSGRFMFGETCFGFIGGVGMFAEFISGLKAQESDEALGLADDLAKRVKTDSMARDTIFYFPGVKLEEASAA